MFCEKCGVRLSENAKFCKQCALQVRMGTYEPADISLIIISVFMILSCFVPYIKEKWLSISLWDCAENGVDYILLIGIISIAMIIGSCTLIHRRDWGINFVIIEFILILVILICADSKMKYADFKDLSVGFYMFIVSGVIHFNHFLS